MALFGLFLCVCVLLRPFSAETTVQKIYFLVGKTLELRPPPGTQSLTNVLWKFTQTPSPTVLVAEWNEGDVEVDYYSFKEFAYLDTTTGVLTIKPMNESWAGVYNLEVNQKLLDVNYEATAIEEVPTPKVWVKPGSSGDERALSCTGDVSKAGPVSYWWDINANRSWVQLSSDITLQKNDTTQSIMDFSCKVRNPAGERKSAPQDNPFYSHPAGQAGLWGLVVLLVLPLGGVIAYRKRKEIKEKCCSGEVTPGGEATGGETTRGEASGNGARKSEQIALNTGETEN